MVSLFKKILIKRKLRKAGMIPYGKTDIPKKESALKRVVRKYQEFEKIKKEYRAKAPEDKKIKRTSKRYGKSKSKESYSKFDGRFF